MDACESSDEVSKVYPMRKQMFARALVAALVLLLPGFSALAQGELLDDKVNWRFQRNQDGTTTEFHRMGDRAQTLVKRQFSKAGGLILTTVYRLDRRGNPINCELISTAGERLFYVLYGYDKKTGRLMEEAMFDARMKHFDKDSGEEKPVMRFIYMQDARGKNQRPISIVLIEGRTAQEAFDIGSTKLSDDVLRILQEEAAAQ